MTKWILVLACPLTLSCVDSPRPLEEAEARRQLANYYVAASEGAYQDTATLEIRLTRSVSDAVAVVDTAGEFLATFRWRRGEWTLTPAPGLTMRLRRLAQDRQEVRALAERVDSAELGISDFERRLEGLLSSDHGSAPWAWRLEGARDFLTQMDEYLVALNAEGRSLAGAERDMTRIDGLRDRVREAGLRIDQHRERRTQ